MNRAGVVTIGFTLLGALCGYVVGAWRSHHRPGGVNDLRARLRDLQDRLAVGMARGSR